VNEQERPHESSETMAQALGRLKGAAVPDRIEGKPEAAKVPFDELDERGPAEKGA
jgi:hypothetical protein